MIKLLIWDNWQADTEWEMAEVITLEPGEVHVMSDHYYAVGVPTDAQLARLDELNPEPGDGR